MLFLSRGMCLHLARAGTPTNEDLARRLMTADLSEVHKLMRGTMADPLTAPEAARMAESIRAVFNANAKVLKLLPSSGPRFSVRDWVKGDCQPRRSLAHSCSVRRRAARALAAVSRQQRRSRDCVAAIGPRAILRGLFRRTAFSARTCPGQPGSRCEAALG